MNKAKMKYKWCLFKCKFNTIWDEIKPVYKIQIKNIENYLGTCKCCKKRVWEYYEENNYKYCDGCGQIICENCWTGDKDIFGYIIWNSVTVYCKKCSKNSKLDELKTLWKIHKSQLKRPIGQKITKQESINYHYVIDEMKKVHRNLKL